MRTRPGLLTGVLVFLAASCSTAPAAGPGVIVTVRSTVVRAPNPVPVVTVAAAPSSTPVSSIEVSPTTPPPKISTPSSTRPSSATPTTKRSTTRAGRPTSVAQASADPDVAGPDDGPACAVAPRYSDEAPTGLRADVRAAWVAVRKLAATKKIALCLNDGKRSAAQQIALFDDYVKQYGEAAAHYYVLPPGKSAHVKGYAVDVQPATAYQWLQATKGAQGWCRIYDNEPWHFEYSVRYRTTGCPARLPMPVG